MPQKVIVSDALIINKSFKLKSKKNNNNQHKLLKIYVKNLENKSI